MSLAKLHEHRPGEITIPLPNATPQDATDAFPIGTELNSLSRFKVMDLL